MPTEYNNDNRLHAWMVSNRSYEWERWLKAIPFLSFPSHWQVQIAPPIQGAVMTFHVKLDGMRRYITVYLDCYDIIGHIGQPYFGITPFASRHTWRVLMSDMEELFPKIEEALQAKMKKERGENNSGDVPIIVPNMFGNISIDSSDSDNYEQDEEEVP